MSRVNLLSGSVLNAEKLNESLRQCEDVINGGLRPSDMQMSFMIPGSQVSTAVEFRNWLKSKHVVKPEFYGAPAPRVHMVTSDVHYRTSLERQDEMIYTNDVADSGGAVPDIHSQKGSSNVETFLPIPGLAVSFHVDVQEYDVTFPGTRAQISPTDFPALGKTDRAEAIIHSHFFCKERHWFSGHENSGITDGTVIELDASQSVEGDVGMCAQFALFHQREGSDPVEIRGTRRHQHWNFSGFAFKNHSISAMIPNLKKGIHHIYVGIMVTRDSETAPVQIINQVIVGARNMHIELIYR